MSTLTTRTHSQIQDLAAGAWRLDPTRSSIEFHVPHFWGLVTVKGHFDSYQGRLDLRADPAIELTIDAASLQTGNRKRDQHLRSAAFFDAEHHPQLRFVSDSVALEGDTLRVRGNLSARNSSIPLELDAQMRQLDGELEVEAVTTAPHRQLGMTWSPLGVIPAYSRLVVKVHLVRGRSAVA
jgi:polyisoprenoid-binding protein YceI